MHALPIGTKYFIVDVDGKEIKGISENDLGSPWGPAQLPSPNPEIVVNNSSTSKSGLVVPSFLRPGTGMTLIKSDFNLSSSRALLQLTARPVPKAFNTSRSTSCGDITSSFGKFKVKPSIKNLNHLKTFLVQLQSPPVTLFYAGLVYKGADFAPCYVSTHSLKLANF